MAFKFNPLLKKGLDFFQKTKEVTVGIVGDDCDYICTGTNDDVIINRAINALPSRGGKVVITDGAYTITNYISIKSNITLEISSGATISIPNNYSPTTFVVNGRTIKCLITNSNHSSGNENIKITGGGRITGEGTTQSDTTSWIAVFLYKCTDCKVDSIEVDNFLYGITANGGSLGTERYYAIGIMESYHFTVSNTNVHHTGDDVISVCRSSSYGIVNNNDCSYSKFGHGIQLDGGIGMIFGDLGVLSTNVEIINNICHDVQDTVYADNNSISGGIVAHGGNRVNISGNQIYNTGIGIAVIGDIQNSIASNNQIRSSSDYSLFVAPDMLTTNGINGIKITGNLCEASATQTSMVYLHATYYNLLDIDITGNKIVGDNGNNLVGIYVYADGASFARVNIVGNNVDRCGSSGIAIASNNAASSIVNLNASGNSITRCGYGIVISEITLTINSGLVTGNLISSVRNIGSSGTAARGIYVTNISGYHIADNQIVVSGLALTETGTSDSNIFSFNNCEGSGTILPTIVGASSLYEQNTAGKTVFSKNVGLGTSNPLAKLDINGKITDSASVAIVPTAIISDDFNGTRGVVMGNINSGISADFRFTVKDVQNAYMAFSMPGAGNTGALFGQTRSTSAYIFTNNSTGGTKRNLTVGTVDAKDFIIGTNNIERLRVLSSGYIGIGLNNPQTWLDISGATTSGALGMINISNTYNPGAFSIGAINLLAPNMVSGANYGFTLGKAASNNNRTGVSYVHVADGSTSNYVVFGGFYGSSATPIVALASGLVGINTKTPQRNLHTYSNATISTRLERGSSSTNGIAATSEILHTTSADMVDGFGSAIAFEIQDSAAVVNVIGSVGFIRSGADNSGAFVIYTSNAGSNTEKFRINEAGVITTTGAIELGNASDTTVARTGAGDISVEGNIIYRAGGTDVPVTDGGTGSSTSAGARTNLGIGYALPFSTAAVLASPADSTTYYTGALTWAGAVGINRIYIPRAGNITKAFVDVLVTGTLGSSETSTISIRLNNTTDTTLSSSVVASAVTNNFSNTGLSIAVSAGDYVEIKWVTPTWATNPTNMYMHGILYIE